MNHAKLVRQHLVRCTQHEVTLVNFFRQCYGVKIIVKSVSASGKHAVEIWLPDENKQPNILIGKSNHQVLQRAKDRAADMAISTLHYDPRILESICFAKK